MKKVNDIVNGFKIIAIGKDRLLHTQCVECGEEYIGMLANVRRKTCSCHKEIGKYNGQVINGFKILEGYCKPSKTGNSKAIVYRVQCIECGAISEKFKNCLFKDSVECRCDCKKIVRPGDERLYTIWSGMKSRCSNPKSTCYDRYGGRGITVCDDWNSDFVAFREWAWANGYNDELSIDRIDNDGNYEPSNCRWATREVQANNTSTNHQITINDTTKTIAEWSRFVGTLERTIWARLYHGWSEEEAIFGKRK